MYGMGQILGGQQQQPQGMGMMGGQPQMNGIAQALLAARQGMPNAPQQMMQGQQKKKGIFEDFISGGGLGLLPALLAKL